MSKEKFRQNKKTLSLFLVGVIFLSGILFAQPKEKPELPEQASVEIKSLMKIVEVYKGGKTKTKTESEQKVMPEEKVEKVEEVKEYEGEKIKIKLIEKFDDEERFQDYLEKNGILERGRKVKIIKDESRRVIKAQFLDELGRVVGEKESEEIVLSEEVKKIKAGEELSRKQITFCTLDDGKILLERHLNRTLRRVEGECESKLEKEIIYDSEGKSLGEIKSDGRTLVTAVSPNHEYVIATDEVFGGDGFVLFYSINGHLIKNYRFGGGSGGEGGVKFSKDGKYVGIRISSPERFLFFNDRAELLWKLELEREMGISSLWGIYFSEDNAYIFLWCSTIKGDDYCLLLNKEGELLWKQSWEKYFPVRDVRFNLEKGQLLLRSENKLLLVDLRIGEVLDKIDPLSLLRILTHKPDKTNLQFLYDMSIEFLPNDKLKVKILRMIGLYQIEWK